MATRFPLKWPEGMSAEEIIRRILNKVEHDGDCMLWTGAKLPKGYGQIRIKIGARWLTAQTHRAIWEAVYGPIPGGLFVMHSCDRPACCNVAHLRLGTAAENSADMVNKGRSPKTRNEASGRAKLSDMQVASIRAYRIAGRSCKDIAAHFGVHAAHISRITRGLRRP